MSIPRDWESFLRERHYDVVSGYAPEELADVALPPPLRRFYEVAGRTRTGNLHLVEPRKLDPAEEPMLFVVEEQGVYSFATLPHDDNPPVWVSEPDEPWQLVGEPLERFLLQYALYEHVGPPPGGAFGWGWAEREVLPAILAVIPELPLAPWTVPSRRVTFHAGRDTHGLVFDHGDDRLVEVWAAGTTLEVLEPLHGLVGWDMDPRD